MVKKLLLFFLGLTLIFSFSGLLTPTGASAKNNLQLKILVRKPGKPMIAPVCTATTNDQINDWLYAGWQMPTTGVTYKINLNTKPSNLTNTQVLTTVSNAFNTWTTADSKQIFKYGGTTTAQTARYDGTNAILWKNVTSSALAITYIWYWSSTGQLAEVDTVFNRMYPWTFTAYTGTNDCGGVANTYDLKNIGTHEFGHWVGLDDLYISADKDLTMYGYGYTRELKADSLGRGDITGVNSIAP